MSKIIWASTTGRTYATDRETGAIVPVDTECGNCGTCYDLGAPHTCEEPLDGRA